MKLIKIESDLKNLFLNNIFYDLENGTFRTNIGGFCVDAKGYLIFTYKRKSYKAHRIAWLLVTGENTDKLIDHIDGNKLNNKFCNLREAGFLGNATNATLRKDNTSGYKGVSYNKNAKKYAAQCSVNNKQNYLGSYETAQEASNVYINFAKQHHGEFYREL